MEPTADFALQPEAEGHAALLFRGQRTSLEPAGVSLERQYACSVGYLLFITLDSPFEEALSIYLVNPALELLDALELSNPYTAGLLADVTVPAADEVRFSFFGGDRWSLRVRPAPQLDLPGEWFSVVRRPMRQRFARHWLKLTRLQ